jgi:hypothetical protein
MEMTSVIDRPNLDSSETMSVSPFLRTPKADVEHHFYRVRSFFHRSAPMMIAARKPAFGSG